jgi:L-ascorbate metabolism protein UlaG (beta-lactamase superfamily)
MSNVLIKPFCKGEKLQQQIHEAKKNGNEDSFDIWWLGQSGFLIQWNKVCVLFDPYLSDSLTKKYASTHKPHVRMSELVIEPELLDCVDIVTSSHNHTDHLDADTLKPILKSNPEIKFIIPEANRVFAAERVGCSQAFPTGLNDDEMTHIKGFDFYGVPAAHNEIERDEHGNLKFMGYVVKFGKWTLYHSGDTLWYDSMVEMLKSYKVDIAFLPINGNVPSREVAGNLNTEEAARLGKEIGAKLVIPHHYNLFEFNTADPKDFATEAEKMKQVYRILELGEHWNSKSLPSG